MTPSADAIGGVVTDGIELLPGPIDLRDRIAHAPDAVVTAPHPVALTIHRETGAVPSVEYVGVFAADEHARYLIGLFELQGKTTYVAHAGTWLWPSLPQMFYSQYMEFVQRYTTPTRVGDAAAIDLKVDRRQQPPSACQGE